jgi:hypothetical protein
LAQEIRVGGWKENFEYVFTLVLFHSVPAYSTNEYVSPEHGSQWEGIIKVRSCKDGKVEEKTTE